MISTFALIYIRSLEKYLINDIDDYSNIIYEICCFYLPKYEYTLETLFFKRYYIPFVCKANYDEMKQIFTNVPKNSDYRKCNFKCEFVYNLEYFFVEYKPFGQYFLNYREALNNFKCAFSYLYLKEKELVYMYESIIIVKVIKKYVKRKKSVL
jgi:hypothetical protein